MSPYPFTKSQTASQRQVGMTFSPSNVSQYQAIDIDFREIPLVNLTSGATATASSSYNATYPPSNAIDGENVSYGDSWLTLNGQTSGWLQVDLGRSVVLACYLVVGSGYDYRTASPKSWTLDASNDGIAWDVLDQQNNQTAWGVGEARSFALAGIASYRFYRLNISGNNGQSYVAVGELMLIGKDVGASLVPTAPPLKRNRIVGNRNNAANQGALRWITLRFASQDILAARICISRMNAPIGQNNVCISEAQLYSGASKLTGLTATASDSHASYPPSYAVDGTAVLGNYNGWFTNGGAFNTTTGYATNARGFEALMLKLPSMGAVDALRMVTSDGIAAGRVPTNFEIQLTTDPSATASDPIDSSKWFAVDLLNGSALGTEFAATADGGLLAVVPTARLADAYPQTATYGPNVVPVMTSNVAPSGKVEASGFWGGGYEPWRAFNANTTAWAVAGQSGWISYEFASPRRIVRYGLKAQPAAETYLVTPRNWTFEGWNGSAWKVLDIRRDEIGWKGGEIRYYALANPGQFIKYRLNITMNGGSATETDIDTLELFEPTAFTMNPQISSTVNTRISLSDDLYSLNGGILFSDSPQDCFISMLLSQDKRATWKTFDGSAWTSVPTGLASLAASGASPALAFSNLDKLSLQDGQTLDFAFGLGSFSASGTPVLRGFLLSADAIASYDQTPLIDSVCLDIGVIARYDQSPLVDAVLLSYTSVIDNGFQFTFDKLVGGVTPPRQPKYRSQPMTLDGFDPRVDRVTTTWSASSQDFKLGVNLYVANSPSELRAMTAPSFSTVFAATGGAMVSVAEVVPPLPGSMAQLEYVYYHTESTGALSHSPMAVHDFQVGYLTDEYTLSPEVSGASFEASTLVYKASGFSILTLDTQTDSTFFSKVWALLGRPNGTSIKLFARAFDQSQEQEWIPIAPGFGLPQLGRYIQIRLELFTEDGSVTPLVPRVAVTYTPDPDQVSLPTLHKIKTDELRYVFDVKMLTQMNRSNLTAMYVDVFEDLSGVENLSGVMLIMMSDGKGLALNGAASGSFESRTQVLPVLSNRFVFTAYDQGLVSYDVSFDGGETWDLDVPKDAQMNIPLERVGDMLKIRARLDSADASVNAWGVIF